MFKRAGSGSMLLVTRALGLRRTFFSEWNTRPPVVVDAGLVLAVLRVLGIRVADFARGLDSPATGAAIWEGGPEPVEERATPATRRAVALAYRRMRAELGINVAGLGDVEAGEPTAVEVSGPTAASAVEVSHRTAAAGSDPGPGPTLGAEWLEDLDGRRHTEPETVIRELADHLHQVEPALLPRALGIWGSALWITIELEAAAYVNLRALRLAAAAGDEATVANLLQRRAHIMGDAGDHGRALAFADLAAAIFDRIGDQAGRGRAAVDQSRWLHYLDRPREGDRAAKRALELLPEKSLPRSRFAAYSYRSLCCLDLGEHRRAQGFAEAAEKLPVIPWDRGKLSWIRANIARKLGDRSEAVEHLRRGAETFRTLHYGDTLLISLQLVQALLEDEQPAEALRVCTTMHPLTRPLERNPILSGALAELLRLAVAGRVSLDIVRRVRAKVERERNRKDARARHAWRALAVRASRAVPAPAQTVERP